MMYKTGKLQVTSDVRSKPLEQKRKRGRPAKLPLCLARSPPNRDTVRDDLIHVSEDVPQVELSPEVSVAPSAVYQPPSTPVSTSSACIPNAGNKRRNRRNLVQDCSTTESSSTLLPVAPLKKSTRSKKISLNDPPIAPAKRKGNYNESQNIIKKSKVVDIDYQPEPTKSRVSTRSQRNKK